MRAYKRYIVEGQATLLLGKGAQRASVLKDISLRGAGVVSNHPLEARQKLDIVMNVPSLFRRPVNASGTVVWCNKIDKGLWHAGLDFGLGNDVNFEDCF